MRLEVGSYWWEEESFREDMCGVCVRQRGLTPGQEYRILIHDFPPEVRYYDPMKIKTLYRKFASIPLTEDDILGFANRYGVLGLASYFSQIPVDEEFECGCYLDGLRGETFDEWCCEIAHMQRAIQLWDAASPQKSTSKIVSPPNMQYLREHIHWMNENSVIAYWEEGLSEDELKNLRSIRRDDFALIAERGQVRSFSIGDLVKPAKLQVQRWVSTKLKKLTSLNLIWKDKKKIVFSTYVPTLLSALWLQFAQDIAYPGSKKLGICSVCGEPFPCKRSDAMYCSEKCKKKAQRMEEGQPDE